MIKGFFSIRAKFLGVMSALLIGCLVLYLLIAIDVFKTDKTELIYDLNRSMVSNLSVELETEFVGVSDKFKLFALLSIDPSKKLINENIFGENSDVVFASLYRHNRSEALNNFTNKLYLETYGLETTFFEKNLHSAKPIPFAEILKNGEFFWNASIEGGTPLIGFGRNVVTEDTKGRTTDQLTVVGYIKPDKILKVLSVVKLNETSVVDLNGTVLIHTDFEIMKQAKNYQTNPLFKSAIDSKVNISVASLKDEAGEFLGAFAKTYQGKIIVLSRASKEQAFSAVYQLVIRSISFALIVITLSLLFAFLLSRSLTEPISILVDGMEKVSGGDLSTQINVTSKDETQLLATSFNQMIRDLRQSRDELQEINRELDKKVKERTLQLEIQNQAVKEAQEALLKTTRLASAGEIAGRAAHEVLNPLTGILARLATINKKMQALIQPQLNLMADIFQSWKSDHAKGG
ncbi:MAG: HAMP domain-containing protein, partial [Bdellovibrionota bacterium]